ncbi:hypothetical protein KZZ52_09705 [Dactylosporangium sp. AC04546]|uniref:peptidoglycan-binding domain-containing protein n=1 Tax=Dactylosporangium sp. AC04546 TaxID=2862460 RepID=UPI001EDDF3AF|nr:hypothetical protein [Dactylosporangium sp. AC04546]WVK85638.1 hypothetical protein KZZ52_09705 [Dactylosporangium sp. AC04546]
MRRLARVVVAVVVGLAATFVVAEPASAAVPVCNNYVQDGQIKVPAYNGNEHCWMQTGHTGWGVRILQMSLKYCYGDYLRSIGFPYQVDDDGQFGPITKEALRQVQKLEDTRVPWDVTADGVYGWVTANSIFHTTGISYDCYRL